MSKARRNQAISLLIALCALLFGIAFVPAVQAQSDNLLINPSLEAPYTERQGRVWVAHGWEWAAWDRYMPLVSDGGSSGPIIRPEYKQLTPQIDPRRILDGASAQCWFWAFAVGDAVIYQRVPVTPDAFYQAGGYAQSWVTNTENTSADGEMYFTVGIDPNGGTQAWDAGVIWSPFAWSGHLYTEIKSPIVQAKTDHITVYYRAASKWALRHNDAYWDALWLRRVEIGAQPTPPPAPTQTPQPTPTPAPTQTPTPGQCPSVDEIVTPILEALPQIIYDTVWRVLRELMPALSGG